MYSDARTVTYTQIHAYRVNMHGERSNYIMQTVNGVLRISLVILCIFLTAAKCHEKTKTISQLILQTRVSCEAEASFNPHRLWICEVMRSCRFRTCGQTAVVHTSHCPLKNYCQIVVHVRNQATPSDNHHQLAKQACLHAQWRGKCGNGVSCVQQGVVEVWRPMTDATLHWRTTMAHPNRLASVL